jgi:hypothetical protein
LVLSRQCDSLLLLATIRGFRYFTELFLTVDETTKLKVRVSLLIVSKHGVAGKVLDFALLIGVRDGN